MGTLARIADKVAAFAETVEELFSGKKEYHQPAWPTSDDRERAGRARLVHHRLARIARQERDSIPPRRDAEDVKKAAND
jgi:hypothetical protein